MSEARDRELRVGFSSCPNDTFMFDAWVHGRVPSAPSMRVVMQDIEALNRRAFDADDALPVTKLSVAAAGRLFDRYRILDAGAALGRGCGPLVVARPDAGPDTLEGLRGARVAIPGEQTTAFLLLRIFGPADFTPVPMRFEQVMPAVAAGRCDAGLIIHESRFTYRDHGLRMVADLGVCWEAETGLPLPLGVIVAARDLPVDVVRSVTAALRRSVEHALGHPADSAAYVAAHAQEMDASVCRQHIELYVNTFSVSLGGEGRAAIDTLVQRGRDVGLLPAAVGSPFAEDGDGAAGPRLQGSVKNSA